VCVGSGVQRYGLALLIEANRAVICLRTETGSNFRKVVLNKKRMMDNVEKLNNFIHIPSSETG
jgi:hypothetical protein